MKTTLPTPEQFETWKKLHDYQVSADETYQWIRQFVELRREILLKEPEDIQNYSGKGDEYERINHWITAPKEDK